MNDESDALALSNNTYNLSLIFSEFQIKKNGTRVCDGLHDIYGPRILAVEIEKSRLSGKVSHGGPVSNLCSVGICHSMH